MTHTHEQTGCTCPPLRELVGAALVGAGDSPCGVHRPGAGSTEAIALNNDDALAARLLGAATIRRTKEL